MAIPEASLGATFIVLARLTVPLAVVLAKLALFRGESGVPGEPGMSVPTLTSATDLGAMALFVFRLFVGGPKSQQRPLDVWAKRRC
mmetsp:Transcript_10363/g.38226  ORF Transcript_10363/g.38226 Transcript_10363/m.38226 type:complete len:86 (+) Transcript_10363:1996-2253(+)